MGDRLTLAVIGDPHGEWGLLDRVVAELVNRPIDGVLIVGDFYGGMCVGNAFTPAVEARMHDVLARALHTVAQLGVPCAWVPGNHDSPRLDGPGNVDGRCSEIAGIRVAGIGGAGPTRFGFPYEWNEDDIRGIELPPCDVILSHTPPVDTPLDLTAWGGQHAGSVAIRERAEAHDGVLVCGHIHEAAGAVQLDRCLCLNAGALGHPFGKAQVGFVRRDPALEGRWEVVHEDLSSAEKRDWQRLPTPH